MSSIADMEWGHRFWGRVIGLVYGLPFMYFLSKVRPLTANAPHHRALAYPAFKGYIKNPALKRNLAIIFALGGFQGALGWYMVKSGLGTRPPTACITASPTHTHQRSTPIATTCRA